MAFWFLPPAGDAPSPSQHCRNRPLPTAGSRGVPGCLLCTGVVSSEFRVWVDGREIGEHGNIAVTPEMRFKSLSVDSRGGSFPPSMSVAG